jgi:integrase/recombinase XerD
VQRVLAATSSFFDWAIATEQYTTGENPMQRRIDHALGRAPERHQPFVGAASCQQPIRRTVRVRLPLRLPRPMSREDIAALLASLTTMRDLAIFLLMLDGGLRPGEVLCLQVDDISYGRRRVTVRKRDDHPRGARRRHATNASWICMSRARWTRSTATYCTNARWMRRARSCSWLAAPERAGASR